MLSLIAAVGRNYELGRNNELIWHFKEDMKFFKETTMGHPVIMGRKTFESLPKALPGRRNIVITHRDGYTADGAEVVKSLEEALALAGGDAFVIGGASIYTALLPFCDSLYLTEIDAECKTADAYFPRFDKALFKREVLTEHDIDGVHFEHVLYK
ncbi:MAG: dihydrofolate reductase [Eubacterium sp.]|nr:dihydrofolate reductase [Eubacterium sp.]